jgi:uncharacterized glyoxalase superfamily protein PhnB
MIAYDDGLRAMDWLARAFGFRETTRVVADRGTLAHGVMETGSGLILLLASASTDFPISHRSEERRSPAVPDVRDGVLVYVSGIESHLERARQAGATILSDVETGPTGRRYRAEDLEGRHWMFVETDVDR